MSTGQREKATNIEVTNIGGIDSASLQIDPGVTILTGRNATNRTSMLRAIMAVLGSNQVSIKRDADQGSVKLTLNDETYTRTLSRNNGTTTISGEPYLAESEVADLFAFLLEDNPAREVIRRGYDNSLLSRKENEGVDFWQRLRDVIMQPVDTEAIENEIYNKQQELDEVKTELDRLETVKTQVEQKKQRQTELETEIAELETNIETKQRKLQELDANVDQKKEQQTEREKKLDKLKEKRRELNNTVYELESEQETIQALKDEKTNLKNKLSEFPEEMDDPSKIEREIEELQRPKQSINSTINQLQRIIKFNNELLEAKDSQLHNVLADKNELTNTPTQQLLNSKIKCWTCGSHVEKSAIENVIDQLQEVYQDQVKERNKIDNRIEELQERLREIEETQERRKEIESRINAINQQLEEHERRQGLLEDRREEMEKTIEDVESELDQHKEKDPQSKILEIHKELNELEVRRDSLKEENSEVQDEIEELEAQLEEEDKLHSRYDNLKADIHDLRTRIERLEQQAVENFNDHMEVVLDRLGYENLDRIWLDKVDQEVRNGRRKETKSVFEVHVVRSTEEGVGYTDTLNNLSESEREVTGLIFALAGYLAHEVYETVPFMLLDSLEALDTARVAKLIDYFSEFSEFLVVSLLPEDTRDLPEEYERIEFPL